MAARGGMRGGSAAAYPPEPLDSPCAGGDLEGPKRRTQNPPSMGEGFGGPLPSPDRIWRMSFEGLGLDFELLPRTAAKPETAEIFKAPGDGDRGWWW